MYGLAITFQSVFGVLRAKLNDVSVLKSRAGHLFHLPFVRSVTVYDKAGEVHLHLRKADGSSTCVVREVN